MGVRTDRKEKEKEKERREKERVKRAMSRKDPNRRKLSKPSNQEQDLQLRQRLRPN